MQEHELSENSFIWSFEDELIRSSVFDYVEVKHKDFLDKETDELPEEHPNRFNWSITGFNIEKISELKNNAFIRLFEAALLIGSRTHSILGFIHDAPLIFDIGINQGEIDPREPYSSMPYSKIQHLPDPEEYLCGRVKRPDASWLITPKESAEFAILKGYPEHLFTDLLNDSPMASATATESSQSSNELKPAYLDENHPMFSRELSIAIEAWEHVLSINPQKPNNASRKKLIYEWLEKHHRGLTMEAKHRIAGMLNPDKNGGAPPTN